MRLLSYVLNVHPSVGTMDKYFHLMFRQVLPYIDGKGSITNDHMKGVKMLYLVKTLEKLTKEHPVGWQLEVSTVGKRYEVTAEAGEVEYKYVGPNNDGSS